VNEFHEPGEGEGRAGGRGWASSSTRIPWLKIGNILCWRRICLKISEDIQLRQAFSRMVIEVVKAIQAEDLEVDNWTGFVHHLEGLYAKKQGVVLVWYLLL
jgi:hypothetical protein